MQPPDKLSENNVIIQHQENTKRNATAPQLKKTHIKKKYIPHEILIPAYINTWTAARGTNISSLMKRKEKKWTMKDDKTFQAWFVLLQPKVLAHFFF